MPFCTGSERTEISSVLYVMHISTLDNKADFDWHQSFRAVLWETLLNSHPKPHIYTLTWSSGVFSVAVVWVGFSNRSCVLTFGAVWDRPPSSQGLFDISPRPDPHPQLWPEACREPHKHRICNNTREQKMRLKDVTPSSQLLHDMLYTLQRARTPLVITVPNCCWQSKLIYH